MIFKIFPPHSGARAALQIATPGHVDNRTPDRAQRDRSPRWFWRSEPLYSTASATMGLSTAVYLLVQMPAELVDRRAVLDAEPAS